MSLKRLVTVLSLAISVYKNRKQVLTTIQYIHFFDRNKYELLKGHCNYDIITL